MNMIEQIKSKIPKILISILALTVLVELAVFIGLKPIVFKNNAQSKKLAEVISEPVPDTVTGPALAAEKTRWSKRMDEVGPQKAYEEFKLEYATKNFGSQHMMAHIIGSLLFQKAGIKAQAICDSTFSFGCYHSFFSETLTHYGPSVITQLNQACLDKFGPAGSGCQHGIGHGVMDYFGPKRLLDALNACQPTTALSPIAGCTSGVFMEYNVPILISATTATAQPRVVDPKKPYAPCPGLPEQYRDSCYYSIGQFWDQIDPYRSDYKTQGLLCKNTPNPSQMESCYLGVGNVVAPNNNYDPVKAVASCKQMPDQTAVIICQAGASWSFAANPQFKPLAIQMCEQLNEADHQDCLRRGNLLNPSNQ
jgi:hypothetical protein